MKKHNQLIREIERREYYNLMAPFPVYDTEIINDMKKLSDIIKQQEFNNEPICYCKSCLSIMVKTVKFPDTEGGKERDVDYCVPCGSTEIESSHVSEWEDMYEEKYGERFFTKNK